MDPLFGSLADFDALVHSVHDLCLRVIVDIVPNHTSSAHPWFQAALAALPGSPERRRYLFRDGRGPQGDQPPNDWRSVFGGRAWTRVTDANGRPGQWYLHLFAPEQPDLDWMNEDVRAEFDAILRFWLDRGADGFRIDVAHGLAKDPAMPDLDARFAAGGPAIAGHPHWDQDEVHDVYTRWRRLTDAADREVVFVGEAWVRTPERLARYVRPGELHTAFNFGFLLAPWDAAAMRAVIDESIGALAAVGAPPTWVLSNHDVTRHVTRYGGGEVGLRRARAAALLMLALPGGAYVYQGDELGLPEVLDLPDDVRQDPTFFRTEGARRGRDGCRVPLPWAGDEPPFGFGPAAPAWLPQPGGWALLTAERQAAGPASTLALYRRALRLRRGLPALGEGSFAWLDAGPGVLAFRREPGFACVVNFDDEPAELPPSLVRRGQLLLASAELDGEEQIPGATTAWYAQ